MQRMLGNGFPFQLHAEAGPGDRVLIRLPANRRRAQAPSPNETTYNLAYDDGDTEDGVPQSRIRVHRSSSNDNDEGSDSDSDDPDLEVGTRVMANWENRGQYYPATISAIVPPASTTSNTADTSSSGSSSSEDGADGDES